MNSRTFTINEQLKTEKDPVIRAELKKELEKLILLSKRLHEKKRDVEQTEIELIVKDSGLQSA